MTVTWALLFLGETIFEEKEVKNKEERRRNKGFILRNLRNEMKWKVLALFDVFGISWWPNCIQNLGRFFIYLFILFYGKEQNHVNVIWLIWSLMCRREDSFLISLNYFWKLNEALLIKLSMLNLLQMMMNTQPVLLINSWR